MEVLEMNAIYAAAAAWVDRDIVDGVLAEHKREERIETRRSSYSVGVRRETPQGWIGLGGTCIQPSTRVYVYLQYGSSHACDRTEFHGATLAYSQEVVSDAPLDKDDLAFVKRSVAALRRDFAPDLRVDVKPSAARFNPGLVIN